MPAPPTPPSKSTDSALSGGGWASGTPHTQTSGTPVDYAEYTQWMTIDYTRNPDYTTGLPDNKYRSLTQFSAVDVRNVQGTRLHFNITVHNSCKIIPGNFSLSASYQAQKLSLMANKYGKAGYTYGEVSGATNLYVFGPQGSLITTQPMIRRGPKTTNDVAYSFTQFGTTDGKDVSSTNFWGAPPCVNRYFKDGTNIGQGYEYYIPGRDDIRPGLAYDKQNTHPFAGDQFRMWGGGYNTSSEIGFGDNTAGITWLVQWVEKNCSYLSSSNYKNRFIIPLPTKSDNTQTWEEPVEDDRLVVNPYYDSSLHDYS